MKTIFLIDGAAGTGKSDMVNYLSTTRKRSTTLISKYTTRAERPEERGLKLDLIFSDEPDDPDVFDTRISDPDFYWYSYGLRKHQVERYGFYRKDVESALENFDFVLIIVRDLETVKRVRKDFSHCRVVSVFVYSDRDLIIDRLRNDGYKESEIDSRLERQPLAWRDYVKHSTEYDEVVINSSRHEDYELLLEALFTKYSVDRPDRFEVTPAESYRLVPPLQGFKQDLTRRIERYPFERNVFLMMRFRGRNDRVYRFIKRTLADHGLNGVRADEISWNITHNTYNPVAVLYCCKYGIALFDAPEPGNDYSPNVAYELGIMHDQGKNCLVLKNKAITSVPFDLVHELYVEYEEDLELEERLKDWVASLDLSS